MGGSIKTSLLFAERKTVFTEANGKERTEEWQRTWKPLKANILFPIIYQ